MERAIKNILFYTLAWTILFVYLSPVLWTFVSSIQPEINIISVPPKIDFSNATFANYIELFFGKSYESVSIRNSIVNSVIVASLATLLSSLVGIFSSYAFAKMHFPLRNNLFLFVFSLQMLPAVVIVIPLFLLFRELNLLDSYFGLALAHSTFILPVIVWILKGFFEVFPFEIEDAAKIDGCNRLQILFKIILPLSGPALTSVIIFSFIASWNDFLFALVLTKTQARTVPLAVAEYMGFYQISYTKACASGLIAVIPTILLAMFFEKYIIKGLIRGALKA